MAKVICCPSCTRKLSVHQAVPSEQLFKCPACEAVFAAPAEEKIAAPVAVSRRPYEPVRNGDFTARPLQPPMPRANINDDYDDRRPGAADWDDADHDWPDIRRPVKKSRRRRVLILGGGLLALLLLLVFAFIYFDRSDPALVGSWKGVQRFPAAGAIEVTYHFRPDGTMVDEHIDGGVLVRAPGRYTFSHGVVNIQWAGGGGFERATVRKTGPNTIEYVIKAHSAQWQVGGKTTFTRVAR